MDPDPAQPILDLPTRVGTEAAALAGAIAPYCFALMIAVVMVFFTARLVRMAG